MSALALNAQLRTAERKQRQESEAEAERIIRDAAAGVNIAIRTERSPQGFPVFVAVDGPAREMQLSPALVCSCGREKIHALLAAFAVGATAMVLGDETVDFDVRAKEEATS